MGGRARHFRKRVRARERLVGTFVKLSTWSVVELLGETGLDFVVIDAEHAPLGRNEVDGLLLAARSVDLPAIVRISSADPDAAKQALDCGANGILVPQVTDAAQAEACVAMVRYRQGRGYSNSPRIGRFGLTPLDELVDRADEETVLLCQIESRAAVAAAAAISAVQGMDGIMIGPADLALSLEARSPHDPVVRTNIEAALRDAGDAPKGLLLGRDTDCGPYGAAGATLFVIGSDVALLRDGAANVARAFARTGG